MNRRFTEAQLEHWRRDGGVLIPNFFSTAEVKAVQADFERVFPDRKGADVPLQKKRDGEIGRFNPAQFASFEAVPFDCSPALNLIGVHPQLIAFAKAALATEQVHIYQCQVWAKFTGDADYDQPFHTDFSNHTLTVPSPDATLNSVTVLCYFSDVSEAHGPMHYVTRPDSNRFAPPEASFSSSDPERVLLQQKLQQYERSSAAPAGSIFPYGIDVYHRGTNMTAPGGHRYAVMACFKKAGDDSIGYHAWPFHHLKPWQRIFDHASPEQLACFGVHPPGHPFWTPVTIDRAQARYPGWNLQPYRESLHH